MREINTLKQLAHPSIVKLFECVDTTHNVYLVMEYAKGQPLSRWGQVTERQAVKIIRQLASCLVYLH